VAVPPGAGREAIGAILLGEAHGEPVAGARARGGAPA
jgi:hypothetical protein